LQALGVNLDLAPDEVARCIAEVGIGFLFAPNYHAAMKHAAPVRRELGVRTLFNILGPLTNPAGARNQLLGVFHRDLVGVQVRVLERLGSRHAMVVHGSDGLDEISIGGETMVGELKAGEISEYRIHPEQFGLKQAPTAAIKVGGAEEARAMLVGVLEGRPGPAGDIVALNAGATLYVAGVAGSLAAGVEQAARAISTGAARATLDALVAFGRRPPV
jgi:anthranilate phosphoribosyltransferase